MGSSSTYDEKLLSQAPEVTKADLQDGYNADLLREATVKRASTARVPPLRSNSGALQQQFLSHNQDLESSAAPLQPKEAVQYVEPRRPWWRTVKGIAIIAAVAIIIILVAVLGGVLGSHRGQAADTSALFTSSSSSSPSATSSTSSSPASSPSQGTSQGSASNSGGNSSSDSSTNQGGTNLGNPGSGGALPGSPVEGSNSDNPGGGTNVVAEVW